MNAVEIEEAVSQLSTEPFDPEQFPFVFLAAFGNKEATIKRLRAGNTNKSDVGGVLQRNNIHIAIAEPGRTAEKLAELKASLMTERQKAKFILVTDGEQIEAEEIGSGEALACRYEELGNNFSFFLSLAGISTVREIKNNPIDIKATSRLNRLYVQLLKDNADWSTAEKRGDLNRFMARLIFCFFAEDTGIFNGTGLFTSTIQKMSVADGSNTKDVILELFRTMNLDPREGERRNVRSWADNFPYVNGGLFASDIGCPRFTRTTRAYLIRAGELDWKSINPDIFGSMIQAVADDDERGELGMHYTSVPNIEKVLNPLFLDDLREQLEAAGTNKRKLFNLRQRLSRIRVFDPACGSGNFLVIAYIRMREIEDEILRRRGEPLTRSAITLTQFFGIEIKNFAAEIARLSLLIAEFQCDVRFIGQAEARTLVLPLHATGNITKGNALQIDWTEVCPAVTVSVRKYDQGTSARRSNLETNNEEWETYICGNPPYLGSQDQSKKQKQDLALAFSGAIKSTKSADYVSGWFIKASQYSKRGGGRFAFVTTNSICQGRQVALFWPAFLGDNLEIQFAVPSFLWRNLASHKAAVTVSIVGIGVKSNRPKFVYEKNQIQEAKFIGPYLIPDHQTIVSPSRKVLSGLTPMSNGSMPNDGGGLLMSLEVYSDLVSKFPGAARFCRQFLGSHDSINGDMRYCLWIEDEEFEQALSISAIHDRIECVRKHRLSSDRKETNELADIPYAFGERRHGEGRALLVPRHSSESRPYLPSLFVGEDTVIGDSAISMRGFKMWELALYSSKLHLAWAATVCGKIKTDYRYSNSLGWNTFPVPKLTEQNKADLTHCAENILLAREKHFPATIADLYDPEQMPDGLRAAHDQNDETLERIYIGRRFRNDTERLEKLFDMYTKIMTAQEKAS
ncbi:lactate dehydrogenase [Salinicola sp. MH3R3-1]|uniref:class I SAM-dependent DNA methyltransferase n=1 Tax=Salinicola sp. MH3R3-1 TaxID=1928762 RepID=UPI00094F08B2|nr:DNA methyltransferase [Salinicola sp. MH3R3-1]OLO08372.1 lactate dehydrogenase [Salinicola sp. MH3R3-1]